MRLRHLFYIILLALSLSSCRKAREHVFVPTKEVEITVDIEEGSDNMIDDDIETDADSVVEENTDNDFEQATVKKEEIFDYFPKLTVKCPEQIIIRKGYALSYNQITKNANWVAWHLTREHTDGPWSRDGIPYMVDDEVKGAKQTLDDWYNTNLPIDHGHMCPAGDNKWDKEAMEQTFYLTNMCPQNSRLNNGDWKYLEERCRGWARHYGDIYIVCGPIFYSSKYKTIGEGKVGVPDAFYKVVLYLGKKPKALGFIYPNNGKSNKIQNYVTTVDDVESKTGIDFFYNLPDDVEDRVESISNYNKW